MTEIIDIVTDLSRNRVYSVSCYLVNYLNFHWLWQRMRLYKATYEGIGAAGNNQAYLYILAPNFQTASKLAEANDKISRPLRAAGDRLKIHVPTRK